MKNKPLISIIMNCYNGEKYLEEALNSIIIQTYDNWELIFWDNQSNDGSKLILDSFSKKNSKINYFIASEHTSLYEARNLAIDKTNGDFIAFLDTDDTWESDKLELQIKEFDDKNVGLVCSNFLFLNEINNKKKIWYSKNHRSGYITDELLKFYYVGLLTIMFRKKSLDKLDFIFNPNFNIMGDYDFVIRLSTEYKISYLHKVLATYRWHGNNLAFKDTSGELNEMNNWIKTIHKYDKIIRSPNFKFFNNRYYYLKCRELIKNKERINFLKLIFKVNNIQYILKLLFIFVVPFFIAKYFYLFKFR